MHSKSRSSRSGSLSRNQPYPGQIPRTMPVTQPDFSDYPSSALTEIHDPRFSLTSSSSATRRYNSFDADFMSTSSYGGSGNNECGLFTSAPSTVSYAHIDESHNTTCGPIFPGVHPYGLDSSYDYFNLINDVWTDIDPTSLSLGPSHQSQGPTQDVMPSYFDMSSLGPPTLYSPQFSEGYTWASRNSRPLSPPPELELDLQRSMLAFCNEPDDSCLTNPDFLASDADDVLALSSPGTESYSSRLPTGSDLEYMNPTGVKNMVHPRPIRSASERNDALKKDSTTVGSKTSSDEQADISKARSHAFYEAKAHEDGKFHCPYSLMEGEKKCSHAPTQQKCIYNKYLDSHLRPYRCKFADKGECDDTQFSSAACLFRHEREAHGLWNHGINPFLCKFPDCDRAREGNGFPRRWNRRDHMKRVHEYTEVDSPKETSGGAEPVKRRRGPGVPTSAPMKRSDSSTKSKSRALAGAAMHAGLTGYTPSHALPGRETYDTSSRIPPTSGQGANSTNSRASRSAQQYTRMYPY